MTVGTGCELSARTVPHSERCLQYRRSGSASCRECTVFGLSNDEEIADMANSMCKADGCTKYAVARGFCAVHARENGYGSVLDARYGKSSKSKSDAPVAPVVKPKSVSMVVNGDSCVPFGVSEVVWLALDEAFAAKKAEWASELSGMKPGRAICLTASMIHAVESLGY